MLLCCYTVLKYLGTYVRRSGSVRVYICLAAWSLSELYLESSIWSYNKVAPSGPSLAELTIPVLCTCVGVRRLLLPVT